MSTSDDFDDIDDEDILQAELNPVNQLANLKRASPSGFDIDKSYKRPKADGNDDKNDDDADYARSLARTILCKIWGFKQFKLKQEAAITQLIHGGNACVVFPTGGGKSLVYQIPALAFDDFDRHCGRTAGGGVTLVVSPLIALMKDQVDALKRNNVAAAALDSSQSREAWLDTSEKIRRDKLKILYVAPERLNNEGFVQMIKHVKIRLVAIDEAHCVSEWGHSFRPDYLKVARFVQEIKAERTLCLTATATLKVADDICAAFNIPEEAVFRTTSYRPNLHLLAQSFKYPKEKMLALKSILTSKPGSTIVYVHTHDETDFVAKDLKSAGFSAMSYHAGMSNELRASTQEAFMSSTNMIVCATIAFGMGIDKSNIRNIVHYAIPKSLEGYSQEIGRAGRDGLKSTCMIFLCAADVSTIEQWARADVPSHRSVQGMVGQIFNDNKGAQEGDTIERNLYAEGQNWDVRRPTLDLLYAQLDLRFGYIRAITPKYSDYKYIKGPAFERLTADNSSITKHLKKQSKTAYKFTKVDIDAAATQGRFPRADAVRRLQQWNDSGAIELKQGGVINCFKVLQDFPRDDRVPSTVAGIALQQFEEREAQDMSRVRSVIEFVTTKRCLARELAKHFGDEDSVPITGCTTCNYCVTKKAVEYWPGSTKSEASDIDESKIQAILAATSIRDDARFLARVAHGITSPRITVEKLSKHDVFGCMAKADFEELVTRFAQVCK